MTPAELRAAAERHYHCQSSERDVDVLIDAARRLADVIEHCEDLVEATPTAGTSYADGVIDNAATVLRITRGEPNEREKR